MNSTIPSFERILIVRLSAMGDIIHALPAVGVLREAFPRATLGWVIEERWAELLCTLRCPRSGPRSPQRPLVDRIHTVNTAGWRGSLLSPCTWQQWAIGLSELRGMRYEAAIDLQGAVRAALLASWSDAKTIYGDIQPRENASSMWYSRQVETRGTHVIEQALSLVQTVTQKPAKMAPALLPVDPDAENKINQSLGGLRDFAILNPGAGWGAKQWPAERFGMVAEELSKDGLRSFVNIGPGEEGLAAAVEKASAGKAQRVNCSISELISLTRRASLFVGGDTGPMHLAAALRVPVVAIFGPTNPARNGPFGTRSIVLRSATSTTTHSRRREPEHGLLEITSSEVVAAARNLLHNEPERDH